MDDNTRVAKEKTFWDKLSPEYMYNKNSVGSNAITDRVQVHSRPIHVNSLENIVKQVVEEVTKRKAYVVTEGTAGYILNL